MKLRILSLITLIFSITFLQSVPLLSAETLAKKTMLKPTFGASDSDLPEGPSPGNNTHYKTFTFDLDLPNIAGNDYIDLIAELKEVSKYEGSCANYDPGNLPRKEDLLFHISDYPNKQGEWKYEKWNKLTFSLKSDDKNRTVPTQISVRCYDWGAYGKVTFLFKKKIGFLKWDTLPDEHSIPMDKNKNRIGDGWENDGTKKWEEDKDLEDVPKGTYVKGDGWSVYDEYRGLILKDTDGKSNRLDPNAKDVMVCSNAVMAPYGTGQWQIDDHNLYSIDETYVNNAFTDIYDTEKGAINANTSEETGWVNKYSKGQRGHDKVPGYEPVWAIRIKEYTKNRFGGKPLGGKHGVAPVGSPSYYSLALIFTENTKKKVDNWWTDAKTNYDNTIVIPTAAEKKAIVKRIILETISHEIAHCLALDHCSHAGCQMNTNIAPTIDWMTKDANGNTKGTNKYSSNITGINKGHAKEYAATKVISNALSETTAPSPDMPPDPNKKADAGDGNSMYSLVSSDGSYTATAGTGHQANFTTKSAYSSVYWYVKSPSDTSSLGTNVETDYGDSSTTTTAQLSYSFPSDTSGDYVITAYVYAGDGSVYQTSYTVSVTSSSGGSTEPDTSTPETPTTPTITTPSSPTPFSISSGYDRGMVGLYWSTPTSDGGSTITDYQYSYRYNTLGRKYNKITWSDWSDWSSAGTTGFYVVTGLSSYVWHEFKMRAVNAQGGGTETQTERFHTK